MFSTQASLNPKFEFKRFQDLSTWQIHHFYLWPGVVNLAQNEDVSVNLYLEEEWICNGKMIKLVGFQSPKVIYEINMPLLAKGRSACDDILAKYDMTLILKYLDYWCNSFLILTVSLFMWRHVSALSYHVLLLQLLRLVTV